MLHFLLVVFILTVALCETAVLLLPKALIYLGNKEKYEGSKKFFENMVNELENSDSKLAIPAAVALVLLLVGGLLLLAISPAVLLVATSYSLYAGLGSSLFALAVLSLTVYNLYRSVLGVKDDLNPHTADCPCEKCTKKREVEGQIKAEGISAVLNKITVEIEKAQSKMLIFNLLPILYTWYFLYLVW